MDFTTSRKAAIGQLGWDQLHCRAALDLSWSSVAVTAGTPRLPTLSRPVRGPREEERARGAPGWRPASQARTAAHTRSLRRTLTQAASWGQQRGSGATIFGIYPNSEEKNFR